MQRHAFVLGGTGQIGRAVAREFLSANWSVTISHRGGRPAPRDLVERGARVVILDRDNAGELSGALGSGADVLIDTTAYDRDHGSQLIAVQGCIDSFVVVSSASVYRDGLGRTLDEAMQSGFPELPDPIPETHPTVDPGPPPCDLLDAEGSRWSVIYSTTPPRPSRFCGPARYTARTLGIRGSGGSSNASLIVARPSHWPTGGRAASIRRPWPTSPPWPASLPKRRGVGS
jgi:hypothetical protein